MLPILNIGPLAIQVPGLVLIIGLWLGVSLAERYSNRYGISSNTLYNLVFISIIAGFLGARLTYVFRYPQIFATDPISLISLNPGLLDSFGGLFTAIIAASVYGQRKDLKFWPTLDALTPAMAVFSLAFGLAHLASGSGYGLPTNLSWGIELWGLNRHPTQIYEMIAASIILFVLWPNRPLVKSFAYGNYFLCFVALSAFSRIIIEAFIADSYLVLGGFRAAQLIAWVFLLLCLYGIKKLSSSQDTPLSQHH
jgi:prolipoprotein diacylglyceryltransferase